MGVSTILTGISTTVEAATTNFSDVQEANSHYTAIMDLAQRNIIHGFPDGTFSNIEIPEGEQFIFMINDSLTPLYGTVSSSTGNSVVIRIDGTVPLFATFIHIERESKPEHNLLKEPFTMENTNV